jgi:MFS family permease
VAPHLRRARAGVSVLFLVNAVLYANLVPRLPEVKARLDLSNAALGSAIAAMPLGAMLAGLLAPAVIRWVGSARAASQGLVVLAAAVACLPLAPGWPAFALLMLVVGAVDAVVDVAQNAHGFRVQRAYGRSIVNAFHGVWSVGSVLGGALGSAAAGLSVPLGLHLGVSAGVFGAAALVAGRLLLPGPEDAERPAAAGGPSTPRRLVRHTVLALAALGALAACGALVEDAGASWGALYLRTEVGVGAAAGGLAFLALSVAMTVGRLTGDRVVDRYGQQRVALAGGTAITVGMGLALAVPSLATAVLGFGLAGLGVATLVPAVMHTADELPGLAPGLGLTVVSWLLRVGFLVSPAVVGLVADATSLRVALLSAVVAGLGVLLLGRSLSAVPEGGAGTAAAAGPTSAER